MYAVIVEKASFTKKQFYFSLHVRQTRRLSLSGTGRQIDSCEERKWSYGTIHSDRPLSVKG
jgi:hypothetical protein